MNPIPLQAPFLGIDESVPQAAIQSPNCYSLFNFNNTTQGVNLRNGDKKYSKFNNGDLFSPTRKFGKYGDDALYLAIWDATAVANKFINVDAGTIDYSVAGAYSPYQPQFFNKYLFFFSYGGDAPGRYYNGAAWGAIGYTGTGFTPQGGGNSYNNRNYIIAFGECAYWYSGINAISGALTKIDLSTIVAAKCTLSNIVSITLSDTVTTVALQAFCMSNGEILFYSGSYPDSTDWALVGRAKVGQLVSLYNSVFPYQGDAIILSDSGIASLRDLFLKGSNQAFNFSINKNVQKTWTTIIQAARASLGVFNGPLSAQIKGFWDEQGSRIVIHLPYTYFPNTPSSFTNAGNFFFIYDTINQAWYFHRSYGTSSFADLTYYQNKILFTPADAVNDVIVFQKEGATGFTDRNNSDGAETGFAYEIISAPITNGRSNVMKGEGLDVILNSDLYAETNWYFIRDLGVSSTTAQVLSGAVAGSLQKPFINIGIEGSYIQWKLSGTTTTGKTVGIQLYGVNFWQNLGDSPR